MTVRNGFHRFESGVQESKICVETCPHGNNVSRSEINLKSIFHGAILYPHLAFLSDQRLWRKSLLQSGYLGRFFFHFNSEFDRGYFRCAQKSMKAPQFEKKNKTILRWIMARCKLRQQLCICRCDTAKFQRFAF